MEENIEVKEKNKKRRLYILGPLIILMAFVGVAYAIFNYTRTGTVNVIKVGKISFNSNQTETINLTNVFPIDSANLDTDTTNVDEALITITGDTTYPNGIEYLLTAVDVSNTVGSGNNQKTVPISIAVTATNGLGTLDADYFTNRGSTTSVYKVLADNEIVDDGELVVGYIAQGQTGVSGSVTIKAYLDKDKIGISDTYDGTESDNMGTTNEWADGRTILTTTEWNQLQTNGVSFKVKVEANEGVWVDEPQIPTIDSCPGCKFIFTKNTYYYSDNSNVSNPISTLTTFENNNDALVVDYTKLNKNYFLGFKFDESGNITNAYACGIKGTDYLYGDEQNPGINEGTAFCIEGVLSEVYGGNSTTVSNTYTSNGTILNDQTTGIWQGRCNTYISNIACTGSIYAYAHSSGYMYVEDENGGCNVGNNGGAYCY